MGGAWSEAYADKFRYTIHRVLFVQWGGNERSMLAIEDTLLTYFITYGNHSIFSSVLGMDVDYFVGDIFGKGKASYRGDVAVDWRSRVYVIFGVYCFSYWSCNRYSE